MSAVLELLALKGSVLFCSAATEYYATHTNNNRFALCPHPLLCFLSLEGPRQP